MRAFSSTAPPPRASSTSTPLRRRPSLPSPQAPEAAREGAQEGAQGPREGWRAELARQTKRAEGVVSELDSEYVVLESLLDPNFTTILLSLASQLILEKL